MNNYAISTDYERLWELINSGENIVCFVDYNPLETGMSRVITEASFAEGYYIIGTPGTCHSIGNTVETFHARCKAINLGFIDPASQQKTPKEVAANELYACVCGFLQLPTNDNAVFFQRYQRWTEQAKKIIRDIKYEKVQLEEWEDVTGKEMLLRLRAFPDMLEALEKIAEYGDCFAHKIGERNPHQMVMDALKKARGEA